jgi:Tol biopolymer transport system component
VFRHNIPGDELWTARKVDAITFASPLPMTNLNLPSVDQQPYVLGAAEALVFSSDRNGANFDLWLATRTGSMFGTPVRLVDLNLGGSAEGDPVLSADGLTIYFRSNRAGGPGQFDIYAATRGSTATTAFAPPVLVPNINSSVDDGPSWISPDGCRLYLSSDRDGTNDIFVATRGS